MPSARSTRVHRVGGSAHWTGGSAHGVIDSAAFRRLSRATRALVLTAAILFALAAVALAGLAAASPARAATTGVEKGISYTGYWENAYEGAGARASLRALHATGADWAMVLATVYQSDVDATTISRTEPNTPIDASLRGIIAYAHHLGLKVMLKPHVDLSNDPSHWRGQIGPNFTDADWTAWFAAYNEQIVHYATLAAAAKCEQFSVGCELDSTVGHVAAWRQIIADVRAVYHGKITYADDQITSHPQAVTWWDAVDLIGQDAYPTLSTRLHPTVVQLEAGWSRYYRPLLRLHRRYNKPVIFTEIGIRSIAGAARAPWDWQVSGKVDLVGQSRWYQAALKTFAARGWMKGLFLWQWYTDPTVGGPKDGSYTPHRKPAETVLEHWFRHVLR
jgi:hypothetical protein